MFVEQLRRAITVAPRMGLAALAGALWKGHASGAVGDVDAQSLAELIEARKVIPTPVARRTGSRPRSPDSIERRRRTSAAGMMPPQIAASFTMSETAALSVIATEVARHGRCDLTVGAIAGRAGTCATVVKNAVREARRLGLISVEARRVRFNRSLPNVVLITSGEWLAWLRVGARTRGKGGAVRFAPTTNIKILNAKGSTDLRSLSMGETARSGPRWRAKADRHG